MCFVILLEKDLRIQYLYTKTFGLGVFDHIKKIVLVKSNVFSERILAEDLRVWRFPLYSTTKLTKQGNYIYNFYARSCYLCSI